MYYNDILGYGNGGINQSARLISPSSERIARSGGTSDTNAGTSSASAIAMEHAAKADRERGFAGGCNRGIPLGPSTKTESSPSLSPSFGRHVRVNESLQIVGLGWTVPAEHPTESSP